MTGPARPELDPRRAYTAALLRARDNGLGVSRAGLRLLARAFREAAAELAAEAATTDAVLTAARALSLRRQILGVLEVLERDVTGAIARSRGQAIDVVAAVHSALVPRLYLAQGLRVPASVGAALARVNLRAAAAIAAREANAATFQTLIRRHIARAAPALDRLLVSAVARGVSSRRLTLDLARLIRGAEFSLAERYGLAAPEAAGLRTLAYDVRRIAVSEINNAWREANAQGLNASPVVRAVQWQLSGRHHILDECDVLASFDFYGFGPGFYPPERWPLAPHPFDACYQGAVQLRPAAEWTSPRAPAPSLRIRPAVIDFPADWPAFTAARDARIRATVTAALAGRYPAPRRRAA